MGQTFLVGGILLALCLAQPSFAEEQMTLLIPSQPSIEEKGLPEEAKLPVQPKAFVGPPTLQEVKKEKELKHKAKAKVPSVAERMRTAALAVSDSLVDALAPEKIDEEVDFLIAGMQLFQEKAIAMDTPCIFTVYRFDKEAVNPRIPVEREDILGDLEQRLYLKEKAWGASVGIKRCGLHQFSIETRPWWDAKKQAYEKQIVKTMLPVYGEAWGWHLPVGLRLEIVPHVRPFGLTAPVLFSARVLSQGEPLANLPIEVRRINTEHFTAPTPWHQELVTHTMENGDFSVILNSAGWWCCSASIGDAPLKGPDGKPSPLRLSTLFWLYVDEASVKASK